MQDRGGGEHGIRTDAPANLESMYVGKVDVQKKYGPAYVRTPASVSDCRWLPPGRRSQLALEFRCERTDQEHIHRRSVWRLSAYPLVKRSWKLPERAVRMGSRPGGLHQRSHIARSLPCSGSRPAKCSLSGSVRTREVQITTGASRSGRKGG